MGVSGSSRSLGRARADIREPITAWLWLAVSGPHRRYRPAQPSTLSQSEQSVQLNHDYRSGQQNWPPKHLFWGGAVWPPRLRRGGAEGKACVAKVASVLRRFLGWCIDIVPDGAAELDQPIQCVLTLAQHAPVDAGGDLVLLDRCVSCDPQQVLVHFQRVQNLADRA
ncbi:hypothetical protein K227x_44550 [Rubripirellula lacrimiformis]|uniref:Uncharacterized protein n=1 Tax=Rubripirellula lacrimiformis TaxID=1930273 RepID=A0A517NG41_9BACT|nr:hypothetical protein K227x_44550 [Rubripirellula lacrimiformis]